MTRGGTRRGAGPWRAALIGIGASALGALAGSLAPGGERRQPPLNVVMILVDTLRADHLGMYGYARPTSPRLDAWAAGGVRFAAARSQSGCTAPSVNSILTGRYPAIFLGQPEGRMGFVDGVPTLQEALQAHGYATLAVSASSVVRATKSYHNPHGGYGRGFDTFDERCLERRAACVTRRALAGVDAAREPFFLYAHYLDPHLTYRPPPETRGRFSVPRAEFDDWVRRGAIKPLHDAIYKGGPAVDFSPAELEYTVALYDEEILATDGKIGELLDGLAARGVLERTLVVFLADHGEEFLEHGGVLHCRTVYEEIVRTPLVFSGPGLRPTVVEAPVGNVDVVPTVLAFLGLPPLPGAEGRSLVPLLRGEEEKAGALAFSMQDVYRSAADERFKVILDLRRRRRVRFFDLVADPGETRNLLGQERPAFRELYDALQRQLEATEGGVGNRRAIEAARERMRQLRALGYL